MTPLHAQRPDEATLARVAHQRGYTLPEALEQAQRLDGDIATGFVIRATYLAVLLSRMPKREPRTVAAAERACLIATFRVRLWARAVREGLSPEQVADVLANGKANGYHELNGEEILALRQLGTEWPP